MAYSDGKAVQIKPLLAAVPTRHPLKAARLLYTPPAWVLRGPIYLIFIIVFAGILYAFWAKKDVLVMAPLILKKDAFTVQATGGGLISEINVKENNIVRSGDQLLIIQEQIRPFDNAQREAFTSRQSDLRKELDKVADEYDNNIQQLKYELEDMTSNREAKIQELENQIKILNQQLATANNAVKVSSSALSIANGQYERVNKLFSSHDATISQRDAALEKLTVAQKSVFDAKSRVAEISTQLNTAKVELKKFTGLAQKTKLEAELAQQQERRKRDLSKLQREIASIEQRLNEATNQEGTTYRENQAVYTSIFDGLITKIHVENGQIIAPGAQLLTLVRESAALEGQAFVDNKDIGDLKLGQEVKIKYFAYNYQEYGIASGLISDIGTTPSGLPGKESQYLVKIALREEFVQKRGGKPKLLEMGLEGTAEIKTGEKRFIEILFSPISTFFAPEEGFDQASNTDQ